tara:strand:- start:273 stop:464 length:192 start_codon:yes stop_codon:yes gene_type:complete
MILKIIIGLGLLVFIYLYTRDTNKEPMKNKQLPLFIPSDKFAGAKNGYVFKMDSHGLGYYLDK